MSYYELVSLLDKMITSPQDYEFIKKINNAVISLDGNRYQRFIFQIEYLLTERLKKFMDNLLAKIYDKALGPEELTLELSNLISERNFLNEVIKIKYIKKENQDLFIKSFIKNNNEMLLNIKDFFEDEERQNIVASYMLTEEKYEL